MAVEVKMYKTHDGKTFESMAEAEDHERKLNFCQWFRDTENNEAPRWLLGVNETNLFNFLDENKDAIITIMGWSNGNRR